MNVPEFLTWEWRELDLEQIKALEAYHKSLQPKNAEEAFFGIPKFLDCSIVMGHDEDGSRHVWATLQVYNQDQIHAALAMGVTDLQPGESMVTYLNRALGFRKPKPREPEPWLALSERDIDEIRKYLSLVG